jgi:hypothetical protein
MDVPLHDKKVIAQLLDRANTMPVDTYRVLSESCLKFAKSFSKDPDLMNQNKALFLDALNVKP